MKKITFLPYFFFVLFFCACHSDDNAAYYPLPTNQSLEGEWKLVNVRGGIAGVNDTFADGTILWKFNGISQTVAVTNNNTDDQMQDILPSGLYHYSIVANEATPELCAQTFQIDGTNMGCFNIGLAEFTMNQTETDGFLVTLVR
jgi:hypothetical protein